METHRLNEDTIKVILGPEDLENRGVTMLDLLGNRKQIETFFYSILDEVDIDRSFAEDEAVTFQVMPQTKANGLILLISKGNKAVNQMKPESSEPGDENNYQSKNWEDFFKSNLGIDALEVQSGKTDTNSINDDFDDKTFEKVVKFDNFEDFIELSKMLNNDSIVSSLWLYDEEYYMDILVYVNELHDIRLKEVTAIVNEFSQKTTVTSAMLSEYGKKIMDKTALQLARYHFK
ncbi:adapter protein MecA [Companilactobacillus sp. RD055328]|uniref:adaptor protein MecA n=1 Tax=Companilactobacillus sp. RD055328 TaxID=2916634 RepID=UPI001FC88A87|nr:adaptor protein MecA [Companilactobacillus sp. RD055328]GKQ43087.1 adapter protein MecA [Companilactobacillus sp. RD055328]